MSIAMSPSAEVLRDIEAEDEVKGNVRKMVLRVIDSELEDSPKNQVMMKVMMRE